MYYYNAAGKRFIMPERPLEPPPDKFFHYCAKCGCEVYEDKELCDDCEDEMEEL